jgi:hypothetical protein
MKTDNPSYCFLIECISKYYKDEIAQKYWRFPQFVYHELYEIRPDIAESITGTRHDFYYDKIIAGEKWELVSKIWSQTL